jgi:hypothetical protein
VVNCPITGSGTSLVCNSIPAGSTAGTFASQYNASGSGSTYLNSGNIIVNNVNCTGNTGTSDCALLDLNITGGALTIDTPTTTSFGILSVSTTEATTTADITPVVIQDLRGSYSGWTASCSLTNFAGSNTNFVIPLKKDSDSKYALTPSTLSISQGGSGYLDSTLNDYTSKQNTNSLSSQTDGSGVSNSFTIASFSSGGGQGSYEKTLGNELKIPAFVRNDSYSSVMTCSVS